MISVKISRHIYIRKGPGTGYGAWGDIAPDGNVLQMAGWVTGESIKGTNSWFYNINGNGDKQYYWGGGIAVVEGSEAAAPPNAPTTTALSPMVMTGNDFLTKVNAFVGDGSQAVYHNGSSNFANWRVSWAHVDLDIWRIWKERGVTGRGVTVAVMDTGVLDTQNDLNSAGKIDRINSMNIMTGDMTITDADPVNKVFHGTKSAGLIGANGSFAKTVYGVAPGATLIIYKIMNDFTADGLTAFNLAQTISLARQAGAQVISISIQDGNVDAGLQQALDDCEKAGVFVMASAGDVAGPFNFYPACLTPAFSVGAYRLAGNQRQFYAAKSNFSANPNAFLCPGEDVLTTGPAAGAARHQFTSAAAAFSAGIMALVLEYSRKANKTFSPARLRALLPACCIQADGSKAFAQASGHGILDPQTLLQLL